MATSGVYIIRCGANSKVYVGSSANVMARYRVHKCYLRAGTHPNAHLQAAWSLYGEGVFTFDLLESGSVDQLLDMERDWMERLGLWDRSTSVFSGYGFNQKVATDAYRGIRLAKPNLGRDFSPEWRANIAEGNRRRFARDGHPRQGAHLSDEAKSSIAAKKSKRYVMVNPEGEVVEIVNMKAFCQTADLNHGGMIQVALGRRPSHRGWSRHGG